VRQTCEEASTLATPRSILPDRAFARLAELAHRADAGPARNRRAVASRLAASPLGSTLERATRRPSTGRCGNPRPRPSDGGRESPVGSTADSPPAADPSL